MPAPVPSPPDASFIQGLRCPRSPGPAFTARLAPSLSHQTLTASLSSIVRTGISRRPSVLPAQLQWAPSGKADLDPGQASPPPPAGGPLCSICSGPCSPGPRAQGPLSHQPLGRTGSGLRASFTSEEAARGIYTQRRPGMSPPPLVSAPTLYLVFHGPLPAQGQGTCPQTSPTPGNLPARWAPTPKQTQTPALAQPGRPLSLSGRPARDSS